VATVTYEPHEWVEAPSFWRVFWAVLRGYVLALCTLGIPYIAFSQLGFLDEEQAISTPGPFPVTGIWSLDADLVLAAVAVLVGAFWIRREVRDAAWRPVSLPIVVGVVALTGYAPMLGLRPVELSGIVALPVSAWLIRRFAVGRDHPLRLPRRVAAAAALLGLLVVCSYVVFHPLTSGGFGSGGSPSGGSFQSVELRNSGFADLRVLSVTGAPLVDAGIGGPRLVPPATLAARSSAWIALSGNPCSTRTVTVRFAVLGRTSSRPFHVQGRDCP
jgi:hypothetical protein